MTLGYVYNSGGDCVASGVDDAEFNANLSDWPAGCTWSSTYTDPDPDQTFSDYCEEKMCYIDEECASKYWGAIENPMDSKQLRDYKVMIKRDKLEFSATNWNPRKPAGKQPRYPEAQMDDGTETNTDLMLMVQSEAGAKGIAVNTLVDKIIGLDEAAADLKNQLEAIRTPKKDLIKVERDRNPATNDYAAVDAVVAAFDTALAAVTYTPPT